MKTGTWVRVFEVFQRAVELDESERAQFLDARCGAEADVRAQVELLLAEDSKAGGLLDRAALPSVSAARPFSPPNRIGAFEILHEIASGGMGTVFEAIQDEPRRRVALKMLRTGLRSPAALRRFRFEAEVLGRLQHPGIAQVYASGTHREGDRELPYFALELVEDGTDVLRHAREAGLSLQRRVELFLEVCEAVHHGHQRGVIHRDLKPGNVLVDRAGRVKVIDFGVARVAGDEQALTRATLPGQVVGTLQYMSPEQIAGNSAEVDTRSDVYSLGCLLYELLSGRPPFDLSQLDIPAAALVVQRQEPTLPENVPTDLGWISLKCLEKDPERRFATVNELAEDLRRHLRHEVVRAGPPSRVYQLRKFARRNRVLLAAVAAVIAALSLGLVRAELESRATKRQFERADQEREKAWRVAESLRKTLTAVSPLELGPDAVIVDVLAEAAKSVDEDFADLPEARAMVQNILGKGYLELRLFAEAEEHLGAALAFVEANLERDDPLRIDVLAHQAQLLFLRFDWQGCEELARELETLALERFGQRHEVTLRIQGTLAELLLQTRALEEAQERYDARIRNLEALFGPQHGELIGALGGRALVWLAQGKPQEARTELERVLALAQRALPEDNFRIWNARLNLALGLVATGEYAAAEELMRGTLAYIREHFGDEHPFTAGAFDQLGDALRGQGRYEEAVPLYEQALEAAFAAFGETNASTLNKQLALARALRSVADLEYAEIVLRDAFDSGIDSQYEGVFAEILRDLVLLLAEQGRHEEAVEVLARAYEERRARATEEFVDIVLVELVNRLQNLDRAEEAERISREALAFHGPRTPAESSLPTRLRQLIGTSLAYQDRREEADEVLRVACAEAREGGHDDLVRDILINIAHNLIELGRYDEAEALYAAERATATTTYDADDADDWGYWVDAQIAHLRADHAPGD